MTRLLALTRQPWVRRVFLALALSAAVWAVAGRWDEVRAAWSALPPLTVLAAFAVALAYVLATMASWRAVLTDLGSAVPLGPAARMFLLSQLGKYLPGGVWNLVAAAEIGADLRIPRRRSVTVMAVALLVSIVTGLLVAAVAVLAGPSDVRDTYGVALLALPLLAALLAPPVLNRLLGFLLRRLGRAPLEHPLSAAGVARASAWALLAWLLAGLHVHLLVTALGADASLATAALATGAYALAWTVGFLVVVVPAGVGVREAVLGLVLAGQLSGGAVVIAVLASRLLLTVADLALGLAAARRRR
ncbi:lysylphosphatidylglycerol synthase domain-containing protein [Jiangella endophytica]|uniref:lysylphosphatidylglycerol synthase domain-containing protein n=1 Tax=Jiangella endophytica TaxID=1623398 RepID=UPI000E34414E|nr:lysylphosphatidylglycerol synthase domain-containing protein [Jiangella endophytica]